jgi:DNA modification methylase
MSRDSALPPQSIKQEFLGYLRDMICPGEKQGHPDAVFVYATKGYDWSQHENESVHGIVMESSLDSLDEITEAHRALKPGGHLLLANDPAELTGHTGACFAEDTGFEVRDCIMVADSPEDQMHYVAKASRAEREEGLNHLPERVFGMSGGAANTISRAEEGADGDLKAEDVEYEHSHKGTVGMNRIQKRRNVHPCLHPDALVMTPHGYRPISEIVVGDEVYSADGRFHAVEHVSRHPYTSPDLFEITVMGTNYTTLASDNHPFLVYRPTRKRNAITGGQVLWLRTDQMQKGDYTMTPDLAEPPPSEHLDPEWWFVFGLWVAEGVAQRSGHGSAVYPSFTLHEKETDLIERIKSVFSSVTTSVYPRKGTKAVQVMSFDKVAGSRFVELAGRGAATKCLHPSVWTLPKNIRAAILDGYMAGDGGKVRTYLQAKTVSPDLASQMRLLAASVGYKANLFTYAPVEGQGIGDRLFKSVRQTYQIRLYSENTRNVAAGSRKASRPYEIVHDGVRFVLSYVKAVSRVPYGGDVVNLSVEGSPTFQTAVGMSHNTVKPYKIMERLLHDVPKDVGPVVDPFMGSGTTGIACVQTGHDFIGIEREEEYLTIAEARVRHWNTRDAGWNAAVVESDLTEITEAREAEPQVISLDDLFGL